MQRTLAFTASFILAASAVARAEEPAGPTTKVSGQVRVQDDVRKDVGSDDFVEWAHMRTRLRVDADITANVAAIIEIQDVRTFGEEGSTVADLEGVDLKRGSMLLRRLGGQPLTLELGRMVLAYGDERLIGALEWVDQGRTYDGARLSFAPAGWVIDGFGIRVRETLVPEDDQVLFGAYATTTDLIPDGVLDLYAIALHDDPTDAVTEPTTITKLGTRLGWKGAGVDATAEAAVQLGADDTEFGAVFNGGYTFGGGLAPRAGVELVYGSAGFTTLFPTNHLYYGYLDVAAWSNIVDLALQLQAKPHDTLLVKVHLHHLRLADPAAPWFNAGGGVIRPGDADAASDLGNEADLLLVWKPYAPVTILLGYSTLLPGGFIDDTGPGDAADAAHYFYGQITTAFK